MSAVAASERLLPAAVEPARKFLGSGSPRGYGYRPRLTPDAAAAFATFVDAARTRAGLEGRTLVYTVRWG
jgi:hypothetical protein